MGGGCDTSAWTGGMHRRRARARLWGLRGGAPPTSRTARGAAADFSPQGSRPRGADRACREGQQSPSGGSARRGEEQGDLARAGWTRVSLGRGPGEERSGSRPDGQPSPGVGLPCGPERPGEGGRVEDAAVNLQIKLHRPLIVPSSPYIVPLYVTRQSHSSTTSPSLILCCVAGVEGPACLESPSNPRRLRDFA